MSRCLISTVYHPKSLSVHDRPHAPFVSQKSEFLSTPGLTPFLHWLIILCAGHRARSWGQPPTAHKETIPALMECLCSWEGQAGSVLWSNKIITVQICVWGEASREGTESRRGSLSGSRGQADPFWAGVLWAEAGGGERASLRPCRGHVLGEDGGPRSCRAGGPESGAHIVLWVPRKGNEAFSAWMWYDLISVLIWSLWLQVRKWVRWEGWKGEKLTIEVSWWHDGSIDQRNGE